MMSTLQSFLKKIIVNQLFKKFLVLTATEDSAPLSHKYIIEPCPEPVKSSFISQFSS